MRLRGIRWAGSTCVLQRLRNSPAQFLSIAGQIYRTKEILRRLGTNTVEQQTFWLAEHLASLSVSPVSEADWQMIVATWRSNFLDLLIAHGPDGWSGRTSP